MEVWIKYDKGTLLIRGDARVPNSHWDARSGAYRALALHYADITDYLESSHINYVDEALELL
ncbi:MAG: ATP-dependent helicase, partial [Halobacteriota archaeon]